MKASELKPGQFFEFDIDKRKTRCRRTATGYEYIVEIPEEDFTEAPVNPLAVTGWDDEPQSEQRFPPRPGDWVVALRDQRNVKKGTAYKIYSQNCQQIRFDHDKDYYWIQDFRHAKPSEVPPVQSKPAPLQLREGAWYRRRDGQIVGPVRERPGTWRQKWIIYDGVDGESYHDDGHWNVQKYQMSLDLIAEVPPPVEPVQPIEITFEDGTQWNLKQPAVTDWVEVVTR